MAEMPADKRPLPAYARRGVLLDPERELRERLLQMRSVSFDRTFFQILREDFLAPLFRRKKDRRRR
jgi:hypothetical protein